MKILIVAVGLILAVLSISSTNPETKLSRKAFALVNKRLNEKIQIRDQLSQLKDETKATTKLSRTSQTTKKIATTTKPTSTKFKTTTFTTSNFANEKTTSKFPDMFYFIIRLTIDKKFTEDLRNKDSDAYKNLDENLSDFVQKGLVSSKLFGFVDLSLIDLAPGSIIVTSILAYKRSIKDKNVNNSLIENALKKYVEITEFNISLPINASSINVDDSDSQIMTTRTPVSDKIKYEFSIILTLNMTFRESYLNNTSIEYIQLSNKIDYLIKGSLTSNKLNGIASLEILSFMPGSIIASVLLTYTDKRTVPIDESTLSKAIALFNQNATVFSLSEINVTQIIRNDTSSTTSIIPTSFSSFIDYFGIELTLKLNFNEDLTDITSEAYFNLASNITNFVRNSLENSGFMGFNDASIIDFKSGSIIASLVLRYEQQSDQQIVDSFAIESSLRNASNSNNSLLPIDQSSIVVFQFDPDDLTTSNTQISTTKNPITSNSTEIISTTKFTALKNSSYQINFSINQNFTKSLNDPTSTAYLELKEKMTKFTRNALAKSGLNGMKDLAILSLSPGSIKTSSSLTYEGAADAPLDSSVISDSLVKNGDTSVLPVDLKSISVLKQADATSLSPTAVTSTQASSTDKSTFPVWAIILIAVLGFFFIVFICFVIIMIIILLICMIVKQKNKRNERDNYERPIILRNLPNRQISEYEQPTRLSNYNNINNKYFNQAPYLDSLSTFSSIASEETDVDVDFSHSNHNPIQSSRQNKQNQMTNVKISNNQRTTTQKPIQQNDRKNTKPNVRNVLIKQQMLASDASKLQKPFNSDDDIDYFQCIKKINLNNQIDTEVKKKFN